MSHSSPQCACFEFAHAGFLEILAHWGEDVSFVRGRKRVGLLKGLFTPDGQKVVNEIGGAETSSKACLDVDLGTSDFVPLLGDKVELSSGAFWVQELSLNRVDGSMHLMLSR